MNHYVCNCAESIAASYLAQHGQGLTADDDAQIFQSSLMSGLIAGVYDGEMTLGELFTHGDFGLGTFNQLDGEMIAFDREAHQLHADGSANIALPEQRTPFAVVTHFKPSIDMDLNEPLSHRDIQQLINYLVPSDNLFLTIRLDGEFELVRTRTVPKQTRPYRPMLEAIAEQPTFDFTDTLGTMVGFRCPDYLQGVNVAGYHIHYINDRRDGGGHVLEYRLHHARLQLGLVSKLRIDLPRTREFMDADLTPEDLNAAIRSAEG